MCRDIDGPLLLPFASIAALAILSVGCDGMSGSIPGFSALEFTSEQGWHTEAIQHNNQTREFKYYVPSNLPDDAPAVMALHGATIGMDGMFRRSRTGSREWLEIAEEEGVLILVPDASHDVQPVWNDCTPLPNRGTPDDADFLVALTDWATSRADIDSDSVFVYGVSNGGQMANRLAVEHPDRYAGIAAFISNITANLGEDEECPKPSQPIRVLTVSGRRDQTTPFDGGFAPDWGDTLLSAPATRDFWVQNNIQGDSPPPRTNEATSDNSAVSCEITPAPDTGADVQLCAFDGGHTVPSGLFESTRLTWRFFRDQ
jgi:polyhydroxybutyrate depolymerase